MPFPHTSERTPMMIIKMFGKKILSSYYESRKTLEFLPMAKVSSSSLVSCFLFLLHFCCCCRCFLAVRSSSVSCLCHVDPFVSLSLSRPIRRFFSPLHTTHHSFPTILRVYHDNNNNDRRRIGKGAETIPCVSSLARLHSCPRMLKSFILIDTYTKCVCYRTIKTRGTLRAMHVLGMIISSLQKILVTNSASRSYLYLIGKGSSPSQKVEKRREWC